MKRALVLAGGGSKGQYEVGAYDALVFGGRRYDIIAGVSVGALIGGFIAQYKKEDEELAALALKQFFTPITTNQVWKHWKPLFMLHGFWESSWYNSQPLIDLAYGSLDAEAVRASGRELRLGAVNIDTGHYEAFDQNNEDLTAAILASAANPSFFKPIRVGEHWYIDGGARQVTPIKEAIDAGADAIDIVMTDAEYPTYSPLSDKPKATEIAMRSLSLMLDEVVATDLKVAQLYNQLALAGRTNKRYVPFTVIRPKQNLPVDSFKFVPEEAKQLQQLGWLDAKEALNKESGE